MHTSTGEGWRNGWDSREAGGVRARSAAAWERLRSVAAAKARGVGRAVDGMRKLAAAGKAACKGERAGRRSYTGGMQRAEC